MRTVFLDTVGLIAVWNRTDQWHAAAIAAYQELRQVRARLVTTSSVLLECGNEAARRPYRLEVVRLREELGPAGDLYDPTADDLDKAWAGYAHGETGTAGIIDHISFAVMRRLGISEAFTNDRHFKAAGFTVLF